MAKNMTVKCIRKGFYKKTRVPGETFVFEGKECPSWCLEMGAKKEKLSKDVTPATAAAAYIKTLKSADEIIAFCDGEERKGVLTAMEETLAAIAAETE